MRVLSEKLGLRCVDEKKGLFHLPINSESDIETILNQMSEIEASGFQYNGIHNMVGRESVMVFCCEEQ